MLPRATGRERPSTVCSAVAIGPAYWTLTLAVAHLNIRPGISSCPASSSFLPSNARADLLLTSASFTASKTALSPRTSQTPFEFRNTPCSSLTPCRSTPATYCSIRLFVFLLLSSLALFRFRFAFPAKLRCHEAVSSSFRKRRCVHLAQLTSLSPLLLCQHHTSLKTCVSKIFRSAIDVGTCSKGTRWSGVHPHPASLFRACLVG